MKLLRVGKFTDLMWPTLEGWSPSERSELHQANRDDIERLKTSSWLNHEDVALVEAKAILVSEDQRKTAVDNKASTYLIFIATITPILTYLESSVWDSKVGTAPRGVSLMLLVIATAYLVQAGRWAFIALQVTKYYRFGSEDLLNCWSKDGDPRPRLIREMLISARINEAVINEKVSAFSMAHIFLLRALVCFGALIIVEASWELWLIGHSVWCKLRLTDLIAAIR